MIFPSILGKAKIKKFWSRDPVHPDVPSLRQAEIAAAYYDQRAGGDLYDFIRVNPKRVLFGLLDVAGRAENNREIVTAARDTFRAVGAEALADDDANEAEGMVRLCLELNRTILNAAGRVCASPAFAGCYNEDLGLICYFNAGHTPGLVRDKTGISELPATGLPLGLFSHATCDAPMVVLQPGAALVLVSKGVVEGKCAGNEYGIAGVENSLRQTPAANARELCVAMIDGIQDFMCVAPTHDDVTALALVRDPE
jgi:serine phosphatase RsbU (regulator of sigma subunit)